MRKGKPRWLTRILNAKRALKRIIIPLDRPDAESAIELADRMIASGVVFFKVGLELIMSMQAKKVIEYLLGKGCLIFFDGKFHDIPNTVAGAVSNAVKLGVHIINVHCTGGFAMMEAAAQAAADASRKYKVPRPLVIGVTLLTSIDLDALRRMGLVNMTPETLEMMGPEKRTDWIRSTVVDLAVLAKEAGLDGVVASGQHAAAIKEACGPEFIVVCPGIRFAGGEVHDQKQVEFPDVAAAAGADFEVIGRAITAADDPVAAVKRADTEIQAGLVLRLG